MAQPNLREADWDIGAVINNKLAPALDGETASRGIVAMLTFVLLILRPEINAEQAEMCIKGVSAYIFEFLEGLDTPKVEMN